MDPLTMAMGLQMYLNEEPGQQGDINAFMSNLQSNLGIDPSAPPPTSPGARSLFSTKASAITPGLPMAGLEPIANVRKRAKGLSEEIFASWKRLGWLLRFEEILRKRWSKKTQEQRKKVLITVFPDIPTMHRPDFHAFRTESEEQRHSETKFRHAYLLPFINIEDLVKVKNLLLLLNSRGHHSPDVFAQQDFQGLKFALNSKAVRIKHVPNHVMLLCGQNTPQKYGSLIPLSDPRALSGVHQQVGFGLLVLEIQQKLLSFLVRTTELLVHDLLNSPPPLTARPIILSPPAAIDSVEWPSVAQAAAQSPYCVPVQFNFPRLQSLVSAKRTDAEDHIYALREDPGYFLDTVKDYSEHQMEHLSLINGGKHPELGKLPFWHRVVTRVVGNAYGNLLLWDIGSKNLADLQKLREKYASRISLDKKLPREYEEKFYYFEYLISHLRFFPSLLLEEGLFASPPLRNYYRYQPGADELHVSVGLKSIKNQKDPFFWFMNILSNSHQHNLVGMNNLLDALDNHLHHSPSEQSRLSSWVSSALSDIAVVSEIDREVTWHQPPIGKTLNISPKAAEKYMEKSMERLEEFKRVLTDLRPAENVLPLNKFEYPDEKKRTRETVEKLRYAEDCLEGFWKEIDRHFMKRCGKSLVEFMEGILTPREIQKTPEWTEMNDIEVSTSSQQIPEFIPLDIPESVPISTPTKIKVKTRGESTPHLAAIDIADLEIPASAPNATSTPDGTIRVTKRAHKVFTSLFPAPNGTTISIPWQDFLHAMSSAGFSCEKHHGSAWVFSPNDTGKRGIIFHEPHPEKKISGVIARRFGRRLERVYGWSVGTFVVE